MNGFYAPIYKIRFENLEEAIKFAKKKNLHNSVGSRKLVSYRCDICFGFHVGRGKTIIDNKYVTKVGKSSQIKHL